MNIHYSAQRVAFLDLELTPSEIEERWESMMNDNELAPGLIERPLRVIKEESKKPVFNSRDIWDTI